MYNLLFIILLSFIFSNSHDTEWGKCNLHIYDSYVNSEEIINIIRNTISNMNYKYGKINKSEFDIYITNSKEEYNAISNGSAPIWSIGITKSNQIIIQSPNSAKISQPQFHKVIIHELNHLYVNRLYNNSLIPKWFKEGFAGLIANQFSLKHKIQISKSYWSNSLLSWEELSSFKFINASNYKLAYSQSYALVYGLKYFYGDGVIKKIINQLRMGENFNESIYNVTGYKINTVINKLFEFKKSSYKWMIFLDFKNIIFSILPLILIVSFILKKYNNWKTIKRWEEEELIELNTIDNEENLSIN